MKRKFFLTGSIILVPVLLCAQSVYFYPLKQDFFPEQTGGPELVQIPNNEGQTGAFVTRQVPESTCGQAGTAGGYFFEDDAGFQFNNPEGFIEETYSLAFNFQIDEFISPPGWVRILSFTHSDDVGLYIKLTDPPYHGTLEFWPYGTAGETNFFSPDEFYQLILIRNSNGLINIYVNGQEFAVYDDSGTRKYLPQEPDQFIVFFRDHPYVLEDEASPGFVSSLRITNLSWSPSEVQAIWEDFCSSLLDVPEPEQQYVSIFPNPVGSFLQLEHLNPGQNAEYSILDPVGKEWMRGSISSGSQIIDVSPLSSGLYILFLKSGDHFSSMKFVHR